MIKTELCRFCKKIGYCEFERKVNDIASSVILTNNPDEYKKRAHDTWIDIWDQTVIAREKECEYIYKVDPNYPGKELL